ncbi:hypothetical protein PIB30_034100 [Stylosanthes scabra]|uniref:Uncharacterized protein n=1 Tax=Stylosanthes scabra TaxID=79078 RepID=A0ABU6RCV5_9FABA|nr:hypothetical protein [Stylosanthes scabra]
MEEQDDTPSPNAHLNQPFLNQTYQEPQTRVVTRTLKPVPFKPSKNLNFTRHEKLLRRIGLWDLAHLQFDPHIRVDLLQQLLDSYKPSLQCGYVNGVRVSPNRTQLGLALRLLPLKEEKSEVFGQVLEGLDFAESVEFLEEFMWNWIVLHDDDEEEEGVMVMPNEVLECRRLIREGHFEKVDWAGLMWSMVEREMRELLIKMQFEELIKEVPLVVQIDDEFQDHNTDQLSLGNVQLQKERFQGEEQNLDFILSQDGLQMISGSLFVGKGHKRAIELDYDNKKKLRIDNNNNSYNNADEPVDFDACVTRMQDWMGEAAWMYATKNKSCEDSAMTMQNLLNEIQNRDDTIEDLRKAMVDENKKGQMNVYRLQKELDMMAKLLEAYRKALRETHKAFAEYRTNHRAQAQGGRVEEEEEAAFGN